MFQPFPPIRLPKFVKLIRRLNYPSPFRFEKLQANGIAVAMQWLAVGHPSRGAKLPCARSENQLRTFIPVPDADHARTLDTDVFRKCGLHAGNLPMALEN